MNNSDEVALDFGAEDEIDQNRKLKHPVAVCCHLAFRVAAILAYLFCSLFSDSFITNFILIVILLSMDFWTVKNITGRILVGLRWWNYVDEDGKSNWVYESRKASSGVKIYAIESRIFWLSMVAAQVVWIVFFFATLFSFKLGWFMVVLVGILMNGSNLYGYIRCKYGSKKQFTSMATGFLGQQLWRNMTKSAESQEKPAPQ